MAGQQQYEFNVSKFHTLKFGRNQDLKTQYNYCGPQYNDIISDSDKFRDLGVVISPDGSYINHINRVITKVNQRIGYFLRTFRCQSKEFMKWTWKCYIQPLIDYCSQLWGQSNGGILTRLENTLRSFTSKIDGIKHLNYWQRLSKLNMYSIRQRIERYRILYIWKIIRNLVPNCGIKWNFSQNAGIIIDEIATGKYFINIRENSFHYVAPRLFNKLPRTLRDNCTASTTLLEWKMEPDKFL